MAFVGNLPIGHMLDASQAATELSCDDSLLGGDAPAMTPPDLLLELGAAVPTEEPLRGGRGIDDSQASIPASLPASASVPAELEGATPPHLLSELGLVDYADPPPWDEAPAEPPPPTAPRPPAACQFGRTVVGARAGPEGWWCGNCELRFQPGHWGFRCRHCRVWTCCAMCRTAVQQTRCCGATVAADTAAVGHVDGVLLTQPAPALATADGAAEAELSTEQLLCMATGQPAPRTLVRLPKSLAGRVAKLLQAAVDLHADRHNALVLHPGEEAVAAERVASMWMWLTPSLLKRQSGGPDGAFEAPEDDQRGTHLTRHQQEVKAVEARVALAEVGEWRRLLEGYVSDLLSAAVRAFERPADELEAEWPSQDTDLGAVRRASHKLETGGLRAAKAALLANGTAPANACTREELLALVAMPTAPEEDQQLDALCEAIRREQKGRPRAPASKLVRSCIRNLVMGAEPGPSSWRNSDIAAVAQADGGTKSWQRWCCIWLGGSASAFTAQLWTGALMVPVLGGDRGPEPDAPPLDFPRPKLRPIGLAEPPLKLVEGVVTQEQLTSLLRQLEPEQLGIGTPDAAGLIVRLVRSWALAVQAEERADDVVPQVAVALDLKNAHGAMLRGPALRAAAEANPRYAGLMASEWQCATTVWTRVGSSWQRDFTRRGGWQGLRSSAIMFALSLQAAVRVPRALPVPGESPASAPVVRPTPLGATALPSASSPSAGDAAVATPEPPTPVAWTSARVRAVPVGLQDDTYFLGSAETFLEEWPARRARLLAAGWEVRLSKCKAWAPLYGADDEVPEVLGELFQLFPRAVEGLALLGSAADGQWEQWVGDAAVDDLTAVPAALAQRVEGLRALLPRIRALAEAHVDDRAAAKAWLMYRGVAAQALVYDARLLPREVVEAAGAQDLHEMILDGLAALLGRELPARARRQAELPGPLGGLSLRPGAHGLRADASYWAAWDYHRAVLPRLAGRLGLCIGGIADEAHAKRAQARLRAAGANVEVGAQLRVTLTALGEYAASPWCQDLPVDELAASWPQSVDRFRGESVADSMHHRKLEARVLRVVESLQAARLWLRAPDPTKRVLLSAGGPATGSTWSSIPRAGADLLPSAHWAAATAMRLSLWDVPADGVCQLPAVGRRDGGGAPEDAEDAACGAVLSDEPWHAVQCKCGAVRSRVHKSVQCALSRALQSTGAAVDLERHVPELYSVDAQADGPPVIGLAIMDVHAWWPGSCRCFLVDVSVRSPMSERYPSSHTHVAVAATAGERAKSKRYGDAVHPLVFEPFGRLGVESARTLTALADAAKRAGCASAGVKRHWRVRLERSLLFSTADAQLRMLGSRVLAYANASRPALFRV